MKIKLSKEHKLSAAASAFVQPQDIGRPSFSPSVEEIQSSSLSDHTASDSSTVVPSPPAIAPIAFKARRHRFSCISCCEDNSVPPHLAQAGVTPMLETDGNFASVSEQRVGPGGSRVPTATSSTRGAAYLSSSTNSAPRSILKASQSSAGLASQSLDQRLIDISVDHTSSIGAAGTTNSSLHASFRANGHKLPLNPNILTPISPIPVQPSETNLLPKVREIEGNDSCALQSASSSGKSAATLTQTENVNGSAEITSLLPSATAKSAASGPIDRSMNNGLGSIAWLFKEDVDQLGGLDGSQRTNSDLLIDLENSNSHVWR